MLLLTARPMALRLAVATIHRQIGVIAGDRL